MTDFRTTISPLTWEGEKAPLAKALVAAQKATEAVKKASTNPAFKSKYADLAGVVEAVVPALNDNGIVVMQSPAFDGEYMALTTVFLHESGSSVSSVLHLRPSKLDPQGVGSAVTYARRYALLAMTGAAPEDDDGIAASGPREPHQRRDDPPRRSAALVAAEAAILQLDSVEACDQWKADNKAMLDSINDDVTFNGIAKAWKARRAALAPPKVENRATTQTRDFNAAELEGAL